MTFDTMTMMDLGLLGLAFFVVALVYSLVGHGGGSGYLAVMAIAGLAPEALRPTALGLNILVSAVGLVRFARAGAFRWSLLWPFACASIPVAFLAGRYLELDVTVYRWVLGVILVYSAYRLFMHLPSVGGERVRRLPLPAGMACGALIGTISGLIGVGGGIFLSPLILLSRWATARQTAGVSAAFILANSIAALSGIIIAAAADPDRQIPLDPTAMTIFGGAVVVAGFIGSGIGSRRLGHISLRRMLAVVLVIAGGKMFLPKGEQASRTLPQPPVTAPREDASQAMHRLHGLTLGSTKTRGAR